MIDGRNRDIKDPYYNAHWDAVLAGVGSPEYVAFFSPGGTRDQQFEAQVHANYPHRAKGEPCVHCGLHYGIHHEGCDYDL